MESKKFDLNFKEKLICSTCWSSRKYGLKEICCFRDDMVQQAKRVEKRLVPDEEGTQRFLSKGVI